MVQMETLYAACHLSADRGRIFLGALSDGRLRLSEFRRFPNAPTQDGDSREWDIPRLYQHVIDGLTELGRTYESVNGVSCTSWGHDYLLFDSGGALLTPTYAQPSPRGQASMDKILSRVPRETVYEETGVQPALPSALFQLGAEKPRRLAKAARFLPVADGFNYLLSGAAKIEVSMAGATQLFNPIEQTWSLRLAEVLNLNPHILPPVVSSGTILGPLLPKLAQQTRLEDVTVVASCSHELAAAIVGLPASGDRDWAFLSPGTWSFMGVELTDPILSEAARELGFSNEPGYAGTIRFMKPTPGDWILEECRRFWAGGEDDLDPSVMMHLASQSPPFESLINPMDTRFLTPGDMPLKIKAFCRESGQPVPRRPGAIVRCVLESVALHSRKTLREIEAVTGRKIARLYLLRGGSQNVLLDKFITNALQIPVVIVPEAAVAMGNILAQAIALGQVPSLEEARRIVRESSHFESIQPSATIWNRAFERLEKLS